MAESNSQAAPEADVPIKRESNVDEPSQETSASISQTNDSSNQQSEPNNQSANGEKSTTEGLYQPIKQEPQIKVEETESNHDEDTAVSSNSGDNQYSNGSSTAGSERAESENNHTTMNTEGSGTVITSEASSSADIVFPPTTAIYISNLSRPLVVRELENYIVESAGNVEPKRLWLDNIRTHCFVLFDTMEPAKNARDALNGHRFPPGDNQGSILKVEYIPPVKVEEWIAMEEEAGTRSLKRWIVNYTKSSIDTDVKMEEKETSNNDETDKPKENDESGDEIVDGIKYHAELIIDPVSASKNQRLLEAKLKGRTKSLQKELGKSNNDATANEGDDFRRRVEQGSSGPSRRNRNRSFSPTPSPNHDDDGIGSRRGSRSPPRDRKRNRSFSPSDYSDDGSRSGYSRSPSPDGRGPKRGKSKKAPIFYTKFKPSIAFQEVPEDVSAKRLRKYGIGPLGERSFEINMKYSLKKSNAR